MRWLLALALVLAPALSGCSGDDGDAGKAAVPTGVPADFEDLELQATPTTGVIRGVVVDAAIRPIGAANVQLEPGNRSQTADDEGRFGFSGLDPGTYFLRIGKAGYETVQASAEVVAGVAEPRPTLVRLERLPGTEPFLSAMAWDGFMECSLTVAIAFATGCLIGAYTDDDSRRHDEVVGTPTHLQSELLWEPTQALGENLCMRHYASESMGGDMLGDDVCGPSPLVQAFGQERLNETEVGLARGIERVVWVDDYAADQTFGLALNQRFTVYTHLFYNFVPREGWLFVVDGEHPTPPT